MTVTTRDPVIPPLVAQAIELARRSRPWNEGDGWVTWSGLATRLHDLSGEFHASLGRFLGGRSRFRPQPDPTRNSRLVAVINEAHLIAVLKEFAAYYNRERPHRSPGVVRRTSWRLRPDLNRAHPMW
jgi:hypothetical protein